MGSFTISLFLDSVRHGFLYVGLISFFFFFTIHPGNLWVLDFVMGTGSGWSTATLQVKQLQPCSPFAPSTVKQRSFLISSQTAVLQSTSLNYGDILHTHAAAAAVFEPRTPFITEPHNAFFMILYLLTVSCSKNTDS